MFPGLRRNRRFLGLLVLTCVPVLLLYSSTRREAVPSLPERLVASGVGETQGVRQSMFDGLIHLWTDYVALVDVKRELDRARADLARLGHENHRLAALAAENVRLRQMLGFRDRLGVKHALLAARVIGKDTSPYFRVLRLQLDATSSELRPGLPVVTSEGVVGQINRVFGDHSDVLLLVDARSAVDVVVERNRARGVLKGLGTGGHYRCRIEYLLRTDQVAEGDMIVTSGLDGRFPKDLRVGIVSRVSRRQYGLYQQVEVKPAVDFSRLEEVFIVLPKSTAEGDTPAARADSKASRGEMENKKAAGSNHSMKTAPSEP